MIYADYNFYTKTFKSSLLSESEFEHWAARASEYIDAMTANRITDSVMTNDTAIALKIKCCCCSLVDVSYNAEKNAGKSAEKVGSYSVTYESDEIWDKARSKLVEMYLGDTGLTYRGVK